MMIDLATQPLVLLADGNDDRRRTLSAALDNGYRLIESTGPHDAPLLGQDDHPHLILLGDPVDGTRPETAVRQLRETYPNSIIAVVVNQYSASPESLLDAGVDDILPADIEPALLRHRLKLLAELHTLRKQTQLQQEIFANVNDAIVAIDNNANIIQWNRRAVQLYGVTAEEAVGKNLYDVYRVQWLNPADEGLAQQVLAAKGHYRNEYIHHRRDGSSIYVDAAVNVLKDAADQRIGLIATIQDVTARKHVEQQLAASETRFRNIADAAPIMIYAVDADGTPLFFNRTWLEFVGRSLDEELARDPYEDVHLDQREQVRLTFLEGRQNQTPITVEYLMKNADGDYRWLLDTARPRYLEDGTFLGLIGTCIDITEQKLAQTEMQAANSRFAALIESAPLAITTLDKNAQVTLWNPAAERMFGWAQDEALGQLCPPVPEDRRESFITDFRRALAGEWLTEIESAWQRADGQPIDVSLSLAPLRTSDDQITGVMAVLADITERKRVETAEREQRTLAEALRDTVSALTRTLDPQTVMDQILENVGRVVRHDAANIMQIQGDVARITHLRGYQPALARILQTTDFDLTLPTFRRMFSSGLPCLVDDVLADPTWTPMYEPFWIRSYVATPIRVYGHVVGFLNLDSRQPGAFTSQDVERLQIFADQVAIAIENAQLYDAIRRDASELKSLHRATSFLFTNNLFKLNNLADIAYQIAQAVVKEFGVLDCGVMLVDERKQELVRLARAGRYSVQAASPLYVNGAGLVPEAVRTGKTVYAPDVALDLRYVSNDPRTQSELVIPLIASKGVIGVLDLQSNMIDGFSEQDRRVLQSFAERASAAIENMLLYEEVRRYASELESRVNERTAELHRVKERVEAILNYSSDAILMTRADGAVQQTNHTFNRLFNYKDDELFGEPLSALVRPDQREIVEKAIEEVVSDNRSVRIEVTAITRFGGSFEADVMISPIAERDSRVLSLVCSIRDITARKRIEEELRNALEREKELSDLKSRFISTASHEFRTPLTMIMTASEILRNYGDRLTEDQKRERLDKIQQEVNNVSELLDDLLTISKTDSVGSFQFNPDLADVRRFCAEIAREVQTGIGIEHVIQFQATGDCGPGLVDLKLLRRILFNLLSNAVKYSLSGSTISFNLLCEAENFVFQVQDTGIGIPEEDQRRLFEAFHRARNVAHISGTGLGLAIVKQSAEQHGGTVTFISQVGVGTTFTVTLPRVGNES